MQANCPATRLEWPMIVLPCIWASRGYLGYFLVGVYNAPMHDGAVCS